jgi:hypothetical protein
MEIDLSTKYPSIPFGDINTRPVYQKAKKEFLKDQNDLLCPIIFFINTKHTDTYGQLFL